MIEVTPSFDGLDESTKKCQMKKSFDNCTTNYYLDTVRKKCKCLPFTINNLEEVFRIWIGSYRHSNVEKTHLHSALSSSIIILGSNLLFTKGDEMHLRSF